jgi:hypothetical protein
LRVGRMNLLMIYFQKPNCPCIFFPAWSFSWNYPTTQKSILFDSIKQPTFQNSSPFDCSNLSTSLKLQSFSLVWTFQR